MKPFLFLAALAPSLALAAPPDAAKLLGVSPAAVRKALGKPVETKTTSDVVEEWFRVPGIRVYRVSHRAGKVFQVQIQNPAKPGGDPVAALKALGVRVSGKPSENRKVGGRAEVWAWNGTGNVQRVFVRRSGVESYHYDALAAGLKKGDLIYTVILTGKGGPRPSGGGGMGLG